LRRVALRPLGGSALGPRPGAARTFRGAGKKKGSPRDFQYGVKAVGNSGKKVHWYKDKAVAKEETALASREARALAASKLEDELLEPL